MLLTFKLQIIFFLTHFSVSRGIKKNYLVDFLEPEPIGLPRFPGAFDGDGVFFWGLNFGGLGDRAFFVVAGVVAADVGAFFRPL